MDFCFDIEAVSASKSNPDPVSTKVNNESSVFGPNASHASNYISTSNTITMAKQTASHAQAMACICHTRGSTPTTAPMKTRTSTTSNNTDGYPVLPRLGHLFACTTSRST
ncbi:hypothetical protein ACLB2K_001740 [Fragaria x ananassa]